MVKTRKFSIAAAMLLLMALILPLFSHNARASQISDDPEAEKILNMVQSNEGQYKAALIDADFYDSENGCLAHIQEDLLLNDLQDMADKIHCNIGIIIVHDLHGATPEYLINEFNKREFGNDEDSAIYLFMNLHGNEEYINSGYKDNLLFSNGAYTLYADKATKIHKFVQEGMNGDANPYFGAAMNFGSALVQLKENPNAELKNTEKKPAESKPETVERHPVNAAADKFEGVRIKTSIYKAALLDADYFNSEDGCLTAVQEKELLELMSETADKIKCNVGVIIIYDLHGLTPKRFNEEFNNKFFSYDSDSATFLFLNRHGNADYINRGFKDDMFFKNRAEGLFNKKAERIFDIVYTALDNDENDLYGAAENFCSALTRYGSGFGAFMSKFNISGMSLFVSAVIGVIVALIAVKSITNGYKKKTPVSASHYIDKSRTRINRQVDQFVREYTTSVRISSSSGGHGGGGHGGGGGSHHSGRGR